MTGVESPPLAPEGTLVSVAAASELLILGKELGAALVQI
jgi:hypothetical protein